MLRAQALRTTITDNPRAYSKRDAVQRGAAGRGGCAVRGEQGRRGQEERELQQNPPSALMKWLLQVEIDLANHRQCIAKARADLEAYVTSLGVKRNLDPLALTDKRPTHRRPFAL